MSNALPILFLVLAAGAMLTALMVLWQSLRVVAGASDKIPGTTRSDEREDRVSLLDEKKMLLQAIKDIELEFALGKLSDQDYQRLDQQYRVRAKGVMQALDDQSEPYRAKAAALIAARVARPTGER